MFASLSMSVLDCPITAYRVAGIIREAAETAIREDIVDATVPLNVCSWWRIPPARKQQPRTRSILERMEPSMLACTMRIWPSLRATILTCHTRQHQCSFID